MLVVAHSGAFGWALESLDVAASREKIFAVAADAFSAVAFIANADKEKLT